MSPRLLSWSIPLYLLGGCAAGEPIDALDRELELATETPAAARAEFIVEVTDHNHPVIADSVFAWNGGQQAADAYCMTHAGLGRCATWFVSFETTGPMTLFADLCGELYSQPIAFALQPSADAFTFSSHVTIEADATSCGRALPQTCEGTTEIADAALAVTVVDPAGNPTDVRGLRVRHDEHPAVQADCGVGYGLGCDEWSSQQNEPGRYLAEVDVCGKTFRSGWITVKTDDSGCKTIPEAVTLVVDPGACSFQG